MVASSLARQAPNFISAVTSQPMTPKTVKNCGAGGLCPAILPWVSSNRNSNWQQKPGMESGGRPVAAVRPGMQSPMTRSQTWFMSVPAMARPGRQRSAHRVVATTCLLNRLSRLKRRPASTAGTTRQPRKTVSTTIIPSQLLSPIWLSTAN